MASEEPAKQDADLQQFVDHFLDPGHNDAGKYRKGVERLREAAVNHRKSPLVLPWLNEQSQQMAYYVIPRRRDQLTAVRDLLVAFLGPSLAKYGYDVPSMLDKPHEAPVRERYGAGNVFIIAATYDMTERRRLRTALERMVDVVERSPVRAWSAPKPLGRLLADFEAALLSGAPQVSAAILQQLDLQGGLSAANVKHLKIRLLAAQGRANDLLSLPGLREVLLQDPPLLVKDLVLSALYATRIEPALTAGDLAGAVKALTAPDSNFSLLSDGDLMAYSDQAVTALLVGTYGRGETEELSRSIACLYAEGRGETVPDALASYLQLLESALTPSESVDPASAAVEASADLEDIPATVSLTTWGEVIRAVTQNEKEAFDLCRKLDVRRGGAPIQLEMTSDSELARIFANLSDAEYESVWQYALGPFLQELTRAELYYRQTLTTVMRSIVNQRCDPANLAVLDLLLELFLRTAPDALEYSEFLEQMSVGFDQWVAPETAGQALDFVDRLAAFASPVPDARVQTAQLLLGPLFSQSQRLDSAYLSTARSLTQELALGLEWPERTPAQEDGEAVDVGPAQILVYGLDEGVLQRVQKHITQQHPSVRVVLSAEKVATKQLKEAARNSDFSVMITQCAAHAATNCIAQYAKKVVYPRGAGSASVTHAAITALHERAVEQQDVSAGKR
ncbi:protein DpdD [Streptomyces chilikensis]|uniref:Protein DpdD n=1 Tax=Streptomyces chilikensis TaxID=1194079 RepID=A0ABV3ELZ3_9ACTN